MTATTLKRSRFVALATALQLCKRLSVPSSFRYVIKRNMDVLGPELTAIREAFPQPVLNAGEADGFQARMAFWQRELDEHLDKELTLTLEHMPVLPEINDFVSCPDDPDHLSESVTARNMQNQALVEALMPLIV